MKRSLGMAMGGLLLMATVNIWADATAKPDTASPRTIVMQNELVRLVINLELGAHVTSYCYKGFEDADVAFDWKVENGGLFKDLWYTQGWPGEFDKRLYEAEIVKTGPEEAIVKTWTKSTGNYGGKQKEDLADILLTKTFRLKKNERMLEVAYEFTNQGAKGKRPGFWSQHALDFDGQKKNSAYWRLTRFAVDWISNETTAEYGYKHVANVIAGWNGVTNQKMKRGVMFLMDYNDLLQVYDNTWANTVEWMYDDVAIPAGKTWKTVIRIIPTEGFAGYTHGGMDVIGYVTAAEAAGSLRVNHTVAATAGELREVTVETRIRGARGDWETQGETIKTEKLGRAPLEKTLMVTGIGPMPCVVKVIVIGKGADGQAVKVEYEDYYGGSAGRNYDLATSDPIVAFPAPEKRKQYLKPDKIALQRSAPPRILFVRGLWAEYNGIDEAVKQLGDVTVVNGWMKKSALGETLGNFPGSYDDLLGYDMIILGNVSGPMLGMVGQEMLVDYVKAGGGLLLLGGDRTYGQAKFSNPNFTQLLPVACDKPRDYGRLKAPQKLTVNSKHVATKGRAFTADAVVLYAHRLPPKDKSVVAVALADGTPALVLSGDDASRVACVGLLPFGEAPAGQKLYGETEAWQKLMAGTLKWLMRKDK